MEANEIQILIEALLGKTQSKEADWQKSSRDNEFLLKLGSGTISLDSRDDNFETNLDITIFNKRGDVIFNTSVSPGNPVYSAVGKLHDAARASYFKTDETIKGLISDLKKPGVVGTPVVKSKQETLDEDVPF